MKKSFGARLFRLAVAGLLLAAPAAPGNPAQAATPPQVSLLKDINLTGSSLPLHLTGVNGTLFFTANDGIHGVELWKSDGTSSGTVMVADINHGGSSTPNLLTDVNGTLFFEANDGVSGLELWKSDGTAAGTVLVKDIVPGAGGSFPDYLTNVGGTLFFKALDAAHGAELWKSDGTGAGTVLVADINPGAGNSNPAYLTDVNGTVFFQATEPVHGGELWRSDGTAAGTVLVMDINPGAGNSFPYELIHENGTLFFPAVYAYDPNGKFVGSELMSTGGLVKDINQSGNGNPSRMTDVNGILFFTASDGPFHGFELWTSDGTTGGTRMVKDIAPGPADASPGGLTNVNGTLFFTANDVVHGAELWKSDGTEAGTVLVLEITPGNSTSSGPINLMNVGGTLFFNAFEFSHGAELWMSDGTAAGTVLVADIRPGTAGSNPYYLANVNGTLFFTADDGVHGSEVWTTGAITDPPQITSASGVTFTEGAPGSFTVKATGSPTPTFGVSGALPSGVTFDPATGVLGGPPATGTAGAYPLMITASNGVPPDDIQPFTLTVNAPVGADTTPPALMLPPGATVEATGPSGAVVNFTATALDLVDGSRPVTCVPMSGSTFPIGMTTVNCTASDLSGNVAQGSFTVTVQLPAPPVVTLPANLTLEATGASGAVVNFIAIAVDLVDGPRPVTCVPASGATFPVGVTTVDCSASDLNGHVANDSFTVTVLPAAPPVLALPANLTLEAMGLSGVVVNFIATAVDLIDGPRPVTCAPASGSTFPVNLIFPTTVNCSASDLTGHVATGSFTVMVQPGVPPVLTLPANMAIEATGTSGAVVTFTATALDAFDGPRPVTCVPPSGSTFPINPINSTTVNCSASDLSGNVASGSFDVAVRDTRPPVLSLPASLTLEATGPFGAAASFTATATDLVDGPLPVACVPASGSTFSLGMTTVDCSADDLSRNLASGSFTVTVQDTKPPVLTLPGNLALAATGPFGAMATFTATAADLVDGPLPVTCVPPSGATFPLGTTTVDCSAGDQAGHVVHGSFAIVVGDVTPPVVIPPAPISVLATELGGARGAAVPALAAFLGAGSANDSIDPAPVRLLPQVSGIDVDDQSLFAAGTTTVTFRYRDAAGNTGIATSTVFVEGAAAQISDLIPVVRSLGLSRKLTGNLVTKLQDAVSYLNAGKVTRACVKLEKFIEVVNAQSGKGIAPADASALIAEATRIRSVLGCL